MCAIATTGSPADLQGSTLIVIAFEDKPLQGRLAALDSAADQLFSRLLGSNEISSKPGKTSLLYRVPGVAAENVLVVGGGPQANFDQGAAFRAAGAAAKRLADQPRKLVFDFGRLVPPVAAACVAGAMQGAVGQDLFRASKNLKSSRQCHLAEYGARPIGSRSTFGRGHAADSRIGQPACKLSVPYRVRLVCRQCSRVLRIGNGGVG